MIANDPEALADFREAMKGQGKRNDIPNILYNIKEVQAGTGKAYTPLRLSTVRSMPPTRWRATSCNGDGIGMGLVGTENKKATLPLFYLSAGSADLIPGRAEIFNTLHHNP